jgi:hypothetical protein
MALHILDILENAAGAESKLMETGNGEAEVT